MTCRNKLYFIAPQIKVPISTEEGPRLTAWYSAQQELRKRVLKFWALRNGTEVREPDPALHSPHFGLLFLASWLRREGHDVVYVDEEYQKQKGHWQSILNEMTQRAAGIFVGGITVHYNHVQDLICYLKQCTRAVIIAGGHHATYRERDALGAGADLVVRGEGEIAASHIANLIVHGRCTWDEVPGVSFLSGNELVRIPKPKPISLHELPDFPYDMVPLEQRKAVDLYVFPSRGCRYNCIFCAEGRYWGGHRMQTPERICALIGAHQKATPFNSVYLYDSSFGEDRYRTLAFCQLFGNRFPGTYLRVLTRLDLLDEELLQAMEMARVIEVLIGIESSDETIRANSGKRLANTTVYEKLENLRRIVPLVKSSWMIGLPGETYESAASTAKMMVELHRRELVVEASVRVATYYPGSPCFESPERHRIKFITQDWSRFHRRCRPPYELPTMTSEDIYTYYCKAMESETAAMNRRIVSFDSKSII